VLQSYWMANRVRLVGWILIATLSGAPVARASVVEDGTPTALWSVMVNVGTLYSIKGQQIFDDLKSNYIQLAGGDADDLDVPEAIIQDGFISMDADEPAPSQSEEEPETPKEPAPDKGQAASTDGADTTSVEQEKSEDTGSAAVKEAADPAIDGPTSIETELAGGDMPGVLPLPSPVRLPTVETVDTGEGAGTLSLDDALPAQVSAPVIEEDAASLSTLTLDDVAGSDNESPGKVRNGQSLALETEENDDGSVVPEMDLAADEMAAVAKPDDTGPEAETNCFELVNVSLVGSTLIDQAMTDTMFGGEIGACITPGLIGRALETLNGYFLDAGFVTTRAYITPQDLKTGTLEITVVEGTIEEIRLNDNTPQDRRRIRMAFAARPGDILNINDIDQGLAQMNRPQSVVAKLNLVPGSEAGQTIVQIDETLVSSPVRYKLGIDNSGSKGTGTTKSTLGVDADNLLSMNETISVSHIGSADTNALAGSVTLPVGRNTIEASGSYSDYLSDVDQYTQIFGRTDTRELKLTRALFKTGAGDVKAEMSLTKKSTRRTINDLVLTPQRLTTARAGLKYSGRLENGTSLSANLYLAAGTKLLNATRDVNLHKTAPRAQFRKVQMDGSATFSQIPGMTIQTSYAGQLAPHPLYSSEQISVGGQKSVRGFKGNAVSGDSGFYAQNDVIIPLPEGLGQGPLAPYAAGMQLYGGLDIGAARDLANGKTNVLGGGGSGMRMNIGGFSGELGAGAPLYLKRGSKNNRIETYIKFLYSIAEL